MNVSNLTSLLILLAVGVVAILFVIPDGVVLLDRPQWRSIAGGMVFGLLLSAFLSCIRDWFTRPMDDVLLLTETTEEKEKV